MITLRPIGNVDPRVLEGLRQALDVFPGGAQVGPPAELPAKALNEKRGQHQASEIIYSLNRSPHRGDRVLGVVTVDLYSPGANFVFGQAAPGLQVAVISLARLRPEFYGQPPQPELLLERASREAVHEVGHLYSLGHCRDPRCVMAFSNTLEDTDRKGQAFCVRCQKKIKGNG